METRKTDKGEEAESISWNRLQSILAQQDNEVAAINKKLDQLTELPADVKILAAKVDSLVGLATLLHQVNNVQSTHASALKIIGTITMIGLPILAAWSTSLNREINLLQTKLVKLETLLEYRKDGK